MHHYIAPCTMHMYHTDMHHPPCTCTAPALSSVLPGTPSPPLPHACVRITHVGVHALLTCFVENTRLDSIHVILWANAKGSSLGVSVVVARALCIIVASSLHHRCIIVALSSYRHLWLYGSIDVPVDGILLVPTDYYSCLRINILVGSYSCASFGYRRQC